MSAAAILTHSYRRHISLDDPQRSFIRFCNNNDAKWLYCKPITSYRQVCIDRTVSIWTDLSCCRYGAFSKVFIAPLIASVNKSTLKETQALFARFVSRIEIKIKDYNEPNYHNEMLIKPGGIWYLQTKKQSKQNNGWKEKQWNMIFSIWSLSSLCCS